MKRNILKLLKLLFGLGIIVFLFSKTSIHEFMDLLIHANYKFFIISIMLYITGQVICARKWMLISEKLNFEHTFFNYIKWYFLGMFYNSFLPTNIGGDVIKITKIKDDKDFCIKRGIISVFSDRVIGLYVLLFFIILGLIFHHSELYLNIINLSIIFCGGIFIVLFLYIIKNVEIIPKKYSDITQLLINLCARKNNIKIIFLSLLFHLSVILIHYCIGKMYNITIPNTFYLILYPISAIISSIPVSVNGIGIKEFIYVYMLKLYGIDASMGILFSMTFSMVVLFSSMLGFIPYIAKSKTQ